MQKAIKKKKKPEFDKISRPQIPSMLTKKDTPNPGVTNENLPVNLKEFFFCLTPAKTVICLNE